MLPRSEWSGLTIPVTCKTLVAELLSSIPGLREQRHLRMFCIEQKHIL